MYKIKAFKTSMRTWQKCLLVRTIKRYNVFYLSEVSLRDKVMLKHFLRKNTAATRISLSEKVTEISGEKPKLDNTKRATRCHFFMWRMTKHEKKPWRMWRMWCIFQIFMSTNQSGGSSSDTEVMWEFLEKTLWLLIPKSHENMVLSEHCSISHTFINGWIRIHTFLALKPPWR